MIWRILALAAILLAVSSNWPAPSWASSIGAPGPGLAASGGFEPCSGQEEVPASENCCFVCPVFLSIFAGSDDELDCAASALALPRPDLAQGTDPEPLRRPPRYRG